jgi:hypothetical protein
MYQCQNSKRRSDMMDHAIQVDWSSISKKSSKTRRDTTEPHSLRRSCMSKKSKCWAICGGT